MTSHYDREDSISGQDIAEAAETLLLQLFSPEQYGKGEKNIYMRICRGGVEAFIYRELLAYTDIVKLTVFGEDEFLSRLAVVYFLNCRHNAKLSRCEKEKYDLTARDDYLLRVIFSSAYQCCAGRENLSWFRPNWYYEDKQTGRMCAKPEHMTALYEFAKRASFRFSLPHSQYVWNAPEWEKNGNQIKIEIFAYSDENKKTYADYIQYLLSKERNSIATFSERGLWVTHMRLSRRTKGLNLSRRNASDTDLLLFCLALGMDRDVYERLRLLRNKAFLDKNGSGTGPGFDQLSDDEKNLLLDFLSVVRERFAVAKSECRNSKEEIPRRMLENAALDMREKNYGTLARILGI